LRCAVTGRYKDRIIFPFYQDTKLIGWTGRALGNPQNAPRYLSSGPEIKETVFNYDQLRWGGRNEILVIAEGPFDALKLDFYGTDCELRATCIFGTSMTLDQIWILNKLARNYKHTYVLLDPDAVEASFAAKDWLTQRNISVAQIPDGIEDPGAMTPSQVETFAKQLHEEADERKKHIPRRKA
jgi:DNA primase